MQNWRNKLEKWIEGDSVQYVIIGIIVLNSIQLGLQTSTYLNQSFGTIFDFFEWIIPIVFAAELIIKLIAIDFRFFKSGWNIFDLLIILLSVLPDAGSLRVLRTLRILRLLRIVRKLPRLRMLIEAVLKSLPSLNWVSILLLLIFYIWGLMGTLMFGDAFNDWFGTIGRSMYTLFQVMTLESWSMGIARPVMEVFPYAWVYFLSFIMIATYTSINIFIAIMVNTMQNLTESNEAFDKGEEMTTSKHPAKYLLKIPEREDELLIEIKDLKSKVDRLEQLLEKKLGS